jgi:hypothetical protein
MNKIFIEAKNKNTVESHFLQAIIDSFLPEKEVEFIYMNGIGNLFSETILNQISLAKENNEQVLVLADADTISKGYGCAKRQKEIEIGMQQHGIQIQYFLYPNNHDDGDIEILIESAARHDLHSVFFDCFHDYEKCVSGAKDANGNPLYNTPNLKGKLHTYISSQQLTKKQRDKLGSGDWLFDNPNYWNLDVNTLQPLKDFLEQNLK